MEEREPEPAAAAEEGGEHHRTNTAAAHGHAGGGTIVRYPNTCILITNPCQELTAAVNDNLDKISTVKSNILKNEEKIEKMISSMGLAHK